VIRTSYTIGSDRIPSRRRDASLLPHITRVDNPYAIPEVSVDVAPGPSGSPTLRTPAMPSEEWRSVAEERFKNLKRVRSVSYPLLKVLRFTARQNMDQPTINVRAPVPPNTIPEMRNRAGWWAFIAGAPELEWNPPKKPKADKEKRRFGRRMRGFADGEDWEVGFEGAEAEGSLPTPHGTPSPSDQPPEIGSRTQREPTPTMLRLIDEVRPPKTSGAKTNRFRVENLLPSAQVLHPLDRNRFRSNKTDRNPREMDVLPPDPDRRLRLLR
jgi:hypothetical protein